MYKENLIVIGSNQESCHVVEQEATWLRAMTHICYMTQNYDSYTEKNMASKPQQTDVLLQKADRA